MAAAAPAPVYLECTINRVTKPFPANITVDEQNQSVTMEAPTLNLIYRGVATFSAKTVSFTWEMYGNKIFYEISRVDLSITETFFPLTSTAHGKCVLQKAPERAF